MDAITIRLKKMLLSGNPVLQEKSIQFMIRSLNKPKEFNLQSTTYLNADMIQFLCEPLFSISTSLIPSICLCIWMLSKNNKFYERNDVLYTCNSVMRLLVFLIKTKDPSVSELIQLLAIIIKKGGTKLQEICNIPQVLTIIKMIFTNSKNVPGCSVTYAVFILTYLLSCPSIELNNKLYNTSIFISKEICKNVIGIDPYVVDIASNLSSSLLRLYSTITSRVLMDENLKKHLEKAEVLKNVALYMIKHICLPFVLKNTNINMYYKTYRKGIKCLISPFKESLSTHVRQIIANHYAVSRIIRISYELIEYNQIGTLVEELLFEMYFCLSSAYLEINCNWPGGTDMFRNQMVWTFKNLPKTPKDICLVLMNSKSIDMKNSIVIFIYFYLLTSSNVENESIYLEPTCVFLCSLQNEIPIPVIKAVLFNISISFVSHRDAINAVTGLALATTKLVALINSQKMFDFVFTHHPALLYFLFATSIIPEKIQSKLIAHWILNLDDISSAELEKFCLNNYKAKLCLLNVLIHNSNIDRNKLQIGFTILKQIITTENNSNNNKTLIIIWNMLPTCLGSFCCTENSKAIGATNLMFLLNLTESCFVHGFDVLINEHRNIVYTMSSIIKTYHSTFTEQYSLLSSLLQHLLILIQLSNVADVLKTIKKHKDFLRVLQNLFLSENNQVCFLTFKIIIKLCQLEKKDANKDYKLLYMITLKWEYIINVMSRQCHNCMIASMTLFQIIIQYYEDTDDRNHVNEAPTIEFLQSVFMQLKTIISQALHWVSDFAWECMTKILSAKLLKGLQQIPKLQIQFATDPWLNFLITNLKFFSEKCLDFLQLWFTHFVLNIEESYTIRGEKVLCPSLFDNTIIHISTIIVNQIYEKSEVVLKAKIIINLILKKKFLLTDGLEYKMNHFLKKKFIE